MNWKCPKSVNITIDFTRTTEDYRQIIVTAEPERIECHSDVLKRAVRLLHKLMHLGMRGKVNDYVNILRILDVANAFGVGTCLLDHAR